ncbi:PLP-dependent transferase [Ramaria rubella]|nr:PLP-dependent transferase [Ramaria rubella]
MISLLAGKPNPEAFPFTSVSFTAHSPGNPSVESSYNITGSKLAAALQYGATSGIPDLVEWMTRLQEIFHTRKRDEGWRVSIGAGSQDVLYKAFHVLINKGDPVLIESPVYAGVIPIFHSLHCKLIEVETDAQGISASSLREILENWPANKQKPRVLYTVPYGCNPTGMTATTERRIAVLELARAHNILILEDDPYYYLYFGSHPRPPSFFTLDSRPGGPAGSVLRFDSFSKILSAGIRIGAVTGPEPLLRAIDMHTMTANLQVSSLTQTIVFTLLSSWGYEGFRKHTENVSELYRTKRDVFETAMKLHLDGLADWVTPEAGMFFWFKLRLPASPEAHDGDSEALIRTKALENGVLALPGTVFLPNGTKTAYVRASFSLLEKDQVNEALRRLGEVIRREQQS